MLRDAHPPAKGPSGFTLAELLVTLALSAVVLATAASLGVRSQRFHRELAFASEQLDQVGQTAALLAVELRAIAPGQGDIPPGEARDTSLQFRTTIGTSVVCDTAQDRITVAPALSSPRLASFLMQPAAGDTAWTLETDAEGRLRWTPRRIGGVTTSVGRCLLGGLDAHGEGPPVARLVLVLAEPDAHPPTWPGAPLRITRPTRYSLYRAADGKWYLGMRDWNVANARFNTIQPVSGRFLPPSGGGLAFGYSDSLGVPIASGAAETHRIAVIEIGIRADSGPTGRWFGLGAGATRTSSALAIRNRAR